ncbi:MAG: hypothetical protein DRP18_02085 [Candidatus Aenigmatarchaeota archaeon]|nr:MAG: hypothetical protein DRP18_02085 [Candidatus Aenigmarchaeota archaeon]
MQKLSEMKPSEALKFISESYIREDEGKFHSFDRRGFVYLVDIDKGEMIVFCPSSDFGRAIGKGGANVKRLQRNTRMKVVIKDFQELPVVPKGYPVLLRKDRKLYEPKESDDDWGAEDKWMETEKPTEEDIKKVIEEIKGGRI